MFLRDVALFSVTAFGGAHAHLAIMLKDFVHKRAYISESELIELNAFTQILPGPSSTQTIIGVAYKVGGVKLAIATFFIWIFPAAAAMSVAAIVYSSNSKDIEFSRVLNIVQPIAIGTVAYAAFKLGRSILKTNTSLMLAGGAVLVTLILRNAFVFPILILIGGIISSALESSSEETQLRVSLFSGINRRKGLYFIGILLLFAALGALINQTSPFSLPIRLFENFYRNGIIIFGGGQVLVPLMFTEFVEMKQYLSADQFLTGFAIQQMMPGPTFSFTSFVGAMTMRNIGGSLPSQIVGSIVATLGINLPGAILVLFFVPFWADLKKITLIKNSLSGINAVAVGFMIAAFVMLAKPYALSPLPCSLILGTFLLLHFTKVRTPILITAGVIIGLLLSY